MDVDDQFRIVLGLGFGALTAVGLTYRIRSNSGESLDRMQEGWFILIGLRVIALIAFVGLIAWMCNPDWMRWAKFPLPIWLRWMGAGTGAVSFALKTWTFHHLGSNLTDTVVTREQHELVTDGPYAWIRHPFYTSFAMDMVSVALMTCNWFILLFGLFGFWFLVIRTRIEEDKLVERFGEAYRDYMQRVGRFLPRLGASKAERV